MKNQALFSSKDQNKKLKCRLLQFCLALQGLIFGQECQTKERLFKDSSISHSASVFLTNQLVIELVKIKPVSFFLFQHV